jgi:hypothetical protein
VVRDLGAALGDMDLLAPRKNDPGSFERQPFVLGVTGRHVDFAYDGWYKNLVRDRIRPQDVAWASDLLGRLSDRQLRDAFRAGGYDDRATGQFIATLKDKIAQGRSLAQRASADNR